MLAHEFGWTIDEIRQLRPSELAAILEEIGKQKEMDRYAEFKSKWAFIAAVITNGFIAIANMFSKKTLKMVEPDDFVDKIWREKMEGIIKEAQKDEWASYIAEAKQKGLKGPW